MKAPKTSREELALENQKRVQRRKEEAAIMRGLAQNATLSIEDLRKQYAEDQSNRMASEEEQRQLTATSKQVTPERPQPVQCVACFDAVVQCLETTHGGATIWTGHEDGSIGIRNGVTGEAVYIIEPSKEEGEEKAPAVTTLYNADTQMWVGLADGTVRIYDTLVYVLAFESHMHDGGITAFVNTFDSKVFSASEDGTIIKWDSEAGNYEVLAHIKDTAHVATCLATYGYNLFAGGAANVIFQYDTETCAENRQYSGHTGPVNALVVAEGFLVSASEDHTVVVWSIDNEVPFYTMRAHEAPVKALFSDTVAARIWSTDSTGLVHIWELSPSRQFPIMSSFQTDEDAAIHRIKGVVATDAVKIWSLGSDGHNKVWHSATNKIEAQTTVAVDAMSSIIAEDAVELAKWNELIRTMEAVAEKLKRSIATTLCTSTIRGEQRQTFYLWAQWLRRQYIVKKQHLSVEIMARNNALSLLRRYYSSLRLHAERKKERKRKEVIAEGLYKASVTESIQEYYRRIRHFYQLVRSREARLLLSERMEARYKKIVMKENLATLIRYRDVAKAQRKRRQLAASLGSATDGTLRRLYFQRWIQILQYKERQRKSRASSAGLCMRLESSLLSRYMQMWLAFASQRRNAKNRARAVAVVLRRNDHHLRATYFLQWQKWALSRREDKHKVEYETNKARVAELLQQLESIDHLVRRRKLLDDAQAAIDAAAADKQRRLERLEELRKENDEIESQIQAKRQGAKEKREKSVAEQVEDLIATLKVKVLNFHGDFPLIHKTQERVKMDKGGVTKIFLEGHIAVKKIVVDLTKESYLKAEDEWPLTDDMVKKLKPHYADTVLNGIKTMVIAFDTMTPADRASLTTDGEIVLNAKWLILFANVCVEMRMKKLGKAGAFRVKH